MSSRTTKPPDHPAGTPLRADYASMARRMVLHGVVTRQQLIEETGLSPGSVTKHIQWLRKHGFIQMRRRAVPHAKKPIDELWLTPEAGAFLIMQIQKENIMGELVGLDLKPLYRYETKLPEFTQRSLLAAMGDVARVVRKTATEFNRSIDLLGICAAGLVYPDHGLICSLHGIPDWEACLPWEIVPDIKVLPRVRVWTQVACKVAGLCDELKRDHQVAYLDCERDHVSLAGMKDGTLTYGLFGSASGLLHVSIAKVGGLCYCGRTGCFHQFLKQGKATPELMLKGLKAILDVIPEEDFALEWRHPLPLPKKLAPASGVKNFRLVENGDLYALRGLRAFAAQATVDRKVQILLAS